MNKENCALKLVNEIILYYDARSKKHQRTVFCFNAASICTVCNECKWDGIKFISKTGTYNFHYCQWHKFTRRALLCNNQYLYTGDCDSTTKSHTECIVVSTAKWLRQRATMSPYTYRVYLVWYYKRNYRQFKIVDQLLCRFILSRNMTNAELFESELHLRRSRNVGEYFGTEHTDISQKIWILKFLLLFSVVLNERFNCLSLQLIAIKIRRH